MTIHNPDDEHSQLTAVLHIHGEVLLKSINTAMPGRVLEYDPSTKRARVQPSLSVLYRDGTEAPRPPIADVPVLQPTGGGFSVLLPIQKNDTVILIFSQRGLKHFKQHFRDAPPTPNAIMSVGDAVAIPGFGPLNISPAQSGELNIQANDGSTAISLSSSRIKLKGNVEIEGNVDIQGNTAITGTTLTHNALNVGSTHTHPDQAGTGPTGPPM